MISACGQALHTKRAFRCRVAQAWPRERDGQLTRVIRLVGNVHDNLRCRKGQTANQTAGQTAPQSTDYVQVPMTRQCPVVAMTTTSLVLTPYESM